MGDVAKVFDKVRLAYDYIVNNTEYGENPNDQNMDSVLVGRKSVCMGYAKAMKYLLDQMGVRSFIVVGTAVNAQGEDTHAWNIIEADGAYFHADPTWGDPLFSGEEGNLDGYVNYAYLGCRDEQILKNHKEDPAWNFMTIWKYGVFPVVLIVYSFILVLIATRKIRRFQQRYNSYYAEDMNLPFFNMRDLNTIVWIFIPLAGLIYYACYFRPPYYKYWLIVSVTLLAVVQFLTGLLAYRMKYDARYLAEYIRNKNFES